MSKKNMYKALNVKSVNVEKLVEQTKDKEIIFGHDVAKENLFGAFMDAQAGRVLLIIRWKHPQDTLFVLDMLEQLEASRLDVAMESSGTYGDSFRSHLQKRSIPVYRVHTKHSHDGHELYDGVPSSHDAKSSCVIAFLHKNEKSKPWNSASDYKRELRATARIMAVHDDFYHRQINRLEALLARHWPELPEYLALTSASLLELLAAYGSPQSVSEDKQQAVRLLRRVSRAKLSDRKIEDIVRSAETTLGLVPIEEERRMIREIAKEARRSRQKAAEEKKRVERLSKKDEVTAAMAPVVGQVTAAVVRSFIGNPKNFDKADAYVKSYGLNLKIKSSGKNKGRLMITKRGPGIARLYLYLAALRLIQKDPIVRWWYHRKIQRDGGLKIKAVVAVMRKLAKALWHVSRGAPFDSRLLFDVTKLHKQNQSPLFQMIDQFVISTSN